MTAANVLDNMPRLPGCPGQGSDAVSAYTQVEMTDAFGPDLRKQEYHNKGTQLTILQYRQSAIFTINHWERKYGKVLIEEGWEAVPGCVHRKLQLFL